MDELTKQVELLTQTLELAIKRQEEAFKLYSEKALEMSNLVTRLLILEEALRKSLSESDGQVDDMARVTAALLKVTQQLEAQLSDDQEG